MFKKKNSKNEKYGYNRERSVLILFYFTTVSKYMLPLREGSQSIIYIHFGNSD